MDSDLSKIIKVADLGVKVTSNASLPFLNEYYKAKNADLNFNFIYNSEFKITFEFPYSTLSFSSKFDGEKYYRFKQYISYLVGFNSKKYNVVHGCGFILNKKGILLMGESNSGKSEIRSMFSDPTTLDDDILFFDSLTKEMRTCEKIGTISEEIDSGIILQHPNHHIEAYRVDKIFLLNGKLDSGYLQKFEEKELPQNYFKIDSLPVYLQLLYSSKKRILRRDIEAYILGTNRKSPIIKEKILSVL